jgi:hypothetical protein
MWELEGVGRVRHGGSQLGLARFVPLDDSGTELAGLRIHVIEEDATLRGLRVLVGDNEAESHADKQKEELLHGRLQKAWDKR